MDITTIYCGEKNLFTFPYFLHFFHLTKHTICFVKKNYFTFLLRINHCSNWTGFIHQNIVGCTMKMWMIGRKQEVKKPRNQPHADVTLCNHQIKLKLNFISISQTLLLYLSDTLAAWKANTPEEEWLCCADALNKTGSCLTEKDRGVRDTA